MMIMPSMPTSDNWQTLNEDICGQHSWLIEYYKKCKSGEIMIGIELITALDKYINELSLPAYRYNLDRSVIRIKFIEENIKLFESPFSGQPFILDLSQKAFIETIFAYEKYHTLKGKWLRRFQHVLYIVGKKNGKTPLASAIALSEWFCGEMGQKILCASNDHEQAAGIFDAINNFREESRVLESVTRKNNIGIFFGNRKQKKKYGKFSKQNKGSIKKISSKGSSPDGKNLKMGIADEIHEMKDSILTDIIKGSFSTQDEPLYIEITTEGIVIDGYLDKRLTEARKVLAGEDDKHDWLIWLYTQDSEAEIWHDERTWVKSNPLLGVSKSWDYLRGLVDDARKYFYKRAFILSKEFNIKYKRPNAWLDDKTIIKNDGTFDLEDFKNHWCIAGVDLSETNDLAAVALLFKRHNDIKTYMHTMYFVPETKAVDPMTTESPTNIEHKDYLAWQTEGRCHIVKGNIIDDNVVAEYLWEVFEKYGIRPYRAGYDSWHAAEFKKATAKHFGDQVPVRITMSPKSLHVPTSKLEDDLRDGLLNFDFNPICIWNFKNTCVKPDSRGQVMPEKLQGYSGNKIDGTMAKVIAYATLREFKQGFLKMVK